MSGAAADEEYFDELVSWATARLRGGEVLLANLDGEDTDFIRFNHGDVRQAGSVRQAVVRIDLIEGTRHTRMSLGLARDGAVDRARLADALDTLRDQRRLVPDDPFLLYNDEPASSATVHSSELPDPADIVGHIRAAAGPADLVGIYAAGDSFSGFGNSLGQRNWHQASIFSLDWSLYLRADKAAKNLYAGMEWSPDALQQRIDWSRRQLDVLRREPIDLAPGGYRAYLAPPALEELFGLWSYSAFGEKSHRTRRTPLLRMVTDGATLAPGVRISEATADGFAPDFQEAGYPRPPEVVLVDAGRYRDTLVSPRSAREYGVDANGAVASETPTSLAVAPGDLPTGQAVEALDTGLYIGNLWYTNYSDRAACRTTGMTRFATYWVDGGEIVAPVNVMRFDDTIYHLLGDRLAALTDEAEVILDASTYDRRSTSSVRVPGALVDEMSFTL